uniref:Uncharacterized protein n=1 Tax=Scleropages formosus TaxID=113540 RepID=A0A8C9TQY1_SCLFO
MVLQGKNRRRKVFRLTQHRGSNEIKQNHRTVFKLSLRVFAFHFLCFSSLSPLLVPLSEWLLGLLFRYILSMALMASVR